jgi:hypothetical protein
MNIKLPLASLDIDIATTYLSKTFSSSREYAPNETKNNDLKILRKKSNKN